MLLLTDEPLTIHCRRSAGHRLTGKSASEQKIKKSHWWSLKFLHIGKHFGVFIRINSLARTAMNYHKTLLTSTVTSIHCHWPIRGHSSWFGMNSLYRQPLTSTNWQPLTGTNWQPLPALTDSHWLAPALTCTPTSFMGLRRLSNSKLDFHMINASCRGISRVSTLQNICRLLLPWYLWINLPSRRVKSHRR